MSGTSLDGLDIAAVEFQRHAEKWEFEIITAETVSYSPEWRKKLENAPALSGEKLIKLHAEYGTWIGERISEFIKTCSFKPDLIASHGHTVFHQPEKNFTFQLGNGYSIAAATKTTTVADFRAGDVALGGQGAPLVPAGDRLLFQAYDYCLNLGGFANISFGEDGIRKAFDICPVNFIFNYFAEKKGLPFDKNGALGKTGKVIPVLLDKLNKISFYQQQPPKSLGREWMEKCFMPLLSSSGFADSDILRTVYEHVALQIAICLKGNRSVLVTGGGANNKFLIELLQNKTEAVIVIPPEQIIDYKEALIFAFLGLLKILGKINCYASVTGATNDSSAGTIFTSV